MEMVQQLLQLMMMLHFFCFKTAYLKWTLTSAAFELIEVYFHRSADSEKQKK